MDSPSDTHYVCGCGFIELPLKQRDRQRNREKVDGITSPCKPPGELQKKQGMSHEDVEDKGARSNVTYPVQK
jgi:hypothetical protein